MASNEICWSHRSSEKDLIVSYIGNIPQYTAFVTDQFSGNGSTTAFTMSVSPANTASVLVAVSGVLQSPDTYSVSGTTLTFSSAPPSGTGNISCRFLGIPASGVTTTAYRTVTEFTATAGQTTFTPPSYTAGYINVYRNGTLLGSADYTATNGTTVVLASGATAGDLVTVESFYVSSVVGAIPATAGAVTDTYLNTGAVTQTKVATGVAGTGPSFSAYQNSGQSISAGTWTKVSLQAENWDTANAFDSSSTYNFTPQVAGYYQVNGCIRQDTNSNPVGSAIYKNGSVYVYGQQVNVTSGSSSLTLAVVTSLVYLNGTTDYLNLYGYSQAGGSLVGLSHSTYFNAALVRAA